MARSEVSLTEDKDYTARLLVMTHEEFAEIIHSVTQELKSARAARREIINNTNTAA